MNICFYTLSLPNPHIGGVERVTYNLVNHFKRAGIGVYHLTRSGDNPAHVIPQDKPTAEKIKFINDFLISNNIDILIDQYGNEPLLEHPHIPANIKIINCYHLTPQSKHICRRMLETFSLRRLIPSLFNLACVINTPRRQYLFRQTVKRKSHGGVDKLVYLSPSYIPYIQRISGGGKKLFSAIPNAAEESLLSRCPTNPANKQKTIIWCGRIVHSQKNVMFLPRLWRKLSEKHPDWNLVIVGDGIDREILEQKIKKYKLERISITGYVNSYPYYETAAISVTPSFFEGFPMVLIEAMALGCVPVVFDNTGSYSDIIDSGKDGYIVPDMDEQAYAEACDRLMTDARLRARMGQRAIQKVHEFSIDKVGARWEELFQELMDEKTTD